jgi:anti-sigma factor RsiW
MRKHPSEANLALYAGGDLPGWRRWSIERHIAACHECRGNIADFSALRTEARSLTEVPEMAWDRLAAEMQANIRLGLEAGECVTLSRVPGFRVNWRAVAACGSLGMLLLVGFLIEQPAPRVADFKANEPAVLESSGSGIQVKEGEQSMMLLNARARNRDDVNYLASGSAMRARYVDADTGYVTINNVYVQ